APLPGGVNPAFRPDRRVETDRLGSALTRPSDVLVEQLGLQKDQGLVLTDIKSDSAAAKAGLKNNDILLELGSRKVTSDPAEFARTLNEFKVGDRINAVVLRQGKREVIMDLTLPAAPR